MKKRLRILSDIHWGHKSSLVSQPEDLEPLVDGTDILIFNGDTIEQKYSDSPNHAGLNEFSLEEFHSTLKKWGKESVFITGNHDPEISETHFLQLLDKQILVTHGDCVFDSIAPWSSNLKNLQQAISCELQSLDHRKAAEFNEYLSRLKSASIRAHESKKSYDPTVWGKFEMLLHQAWPPTRPLKILNCWKKAPSNFLDIAKRFSLESNILIFGHTHKPGIWEIAGKTIINTGSFFSWPGAWLVDISEDELCIRKIRKSISGFSIGKTVRKIKVESTQNRQLAVPDSKSLIA